MDEKIQQEQLELDTLIDRGVKFTIPRTGIWRILGKEKTYTIHAFTTGINILLASEFVKMGFDPDKLREDPLGETKRAMLDSGDGCARVAAIAILGRKCHLGGGVVNHLAINLLAKKLKWQLTPKKLNELAAVIHQMMDFGNFISSIRLMSAMPRVTAPNLMEEKQAG